MNPKIIVIDGKTYHSPDEMPPDIREKYEQAMRSLQDSNNNQLPDAFENLLTDRDQDGIPDAFEGLVSASSMKIIVDGKEFSRIEDLPPDVRVRYEEAMGKMDANKNGVPDFVEGIFSASSPTADASPQPRIDTAPRSSSLPVSPTITPDTSNGWRLVLAGLFLLLLCVAVAGGVWYLFLR